MEAIIFCGIQGSGKSTFYRQRFFDTHVRINRDMLRTRHREDTLLTACIEGKARFVIDNTNPTIAERARHIAAAKQAHFRVVGYYFAADVTAALERNAARTGKAQVPRAGLLGTYKRLQIPAMSEGFDELHYVSIDASGTFIVARWIDDTNLLPQESSPTADEKGAGDEI